MSVTLTVKQVPDQIAEHLRALAAKHHRSLQGELMAILESAVQSSVPAMAEPAIQRRAMEPRVAYPAAESAAVNQTQTDGLLADLDQIVAGSHWGDAPLLNRGQAHDRALAREISYLADDISNSGAGK